MVDCLLLDGGTLSCDDLALAAVNCPEIMIAPSSLEKMAQSHTLIGEVVRTRRPVYGVTTGLGAKAVQSLDDKDLNAFSLQTLRGRAHAFGPPLPREEVRAAMIVRLNSLLTGFSGARPEIAEFLRQCLVMDLVPVVGQIGTIGAADLVLNATLGLALAGEGEIQLRSGEILPANDAFARQGLCPLTLAPRDGLALANNSCFSTGQAALALNLAHTAFEAAQSAASLSLEGFQANLSPLDPRLLATKPLPGQQLAAEGLIRRLSGSPLILPGNARRLQDPLSIRNIAQIHGGAAASLAAADTVLTIELNGISDNPVALADCGDVLSGGGYFILELTLSLEAVSRGFAHLAMAQIPRLSKLLDPQTSGLPAFLARPESNSNGFAPLMKPAEALAGQILHLGHPAPVWPSVNANGIEDCLTSSAVTIRSLRDIAEASIRLSAIECTVAAQAVDLRGIADDLAPVTKSIWQATRAFMPELTDDRPLGGDIDRLTNAIREGNFLLESKEN